MTQHCNYHLIVSHITTLNEVSNVVDIVDSSDDQEEFMSSLKATSTLRHWRKCIGGRYMNQEE